MLQQPPPDFVLREHQGGPNMALKAPKMAVHAAQSAAERKRIYGFRYRTLIAAVGGESIHADHKKQILTDEFDDTAVHLFLANDQRIIASVRMNSTATMSLPPEIIERYHLDRFEEFGPTAISLTTQLVAGRNQRQSQAAAVLPGAAYKVARGMESRFNFSACQPSLVNLYERIGYRRHKEDFVDKNDVHQVPLVLVTEDESYLQAVNSPVARIALEYDHSAVTRRWLDRAFPMAAKKVNVMVMSEENFWKFLCTCAKAPPS